MLCYFCRHNFLLHSYKIYMKLIFYMQRARIMFCICIKSISITDSLLTGTIGLVGTDIDVLNTSSDSFASMLDAPCAVIKVGNI